MGEGHEYEHYVEQANWLSKNQKPFAVIAVETVKTDFIHKYVPEEAMIHNYMPEEARKIFSLFGEKVFIMGSLIWLWLLFHVFVAILIKVPLPYVVLVTVGIFRWPLDVNEVS